jgi:hypothetical protein
MRADIALCGQCSFEFAHWGQEIRFRFHASDYEFLLVRNLDRHAARLIPTSNATESIRS